MIGMNVDNSQEVWQFESNGEIFDSNFIELTSLIDEGSLVRSDKVRKGNLRWIEAGKVPSLISVFNAKDNGQPIAPVITATMLEPTKLAERSSQTAVVNSTYIDSKNAVQERSASCSMHEDIPAVFVCDTCTNVFCRNCPNSYGATVKICPFCGAMCKPIIQTDVDKPAQYMHPAPVDGKFGFDDFGKALAYPFKYKTSLILGAFMFAIFSIGQGASGFGGIFMMWGALMCFLLANTLTFGVLANTIENFSQGKIGHNFMPSFDDFSIWDDVVHPFFLSIGVYIVSFGPLVTVFLIAFFMVVGNVTNEMNALRSDAARTVSPQMPYEIKAADQSEKVRELLKKQSVQKNKQITALENNELTDDDAFTRTNGHDSEEAEFERIQNMIQDSRKAQLESVVGKAPDTASKERSEMISRILSYGVLLLVLAGVCLLWGLFYFPAANIVAGYTRSFAATLNPSVGFDTIRRLGIDYVKILGFGLVLAVVSGIIGGVLGVLFAAFDMPGVGNIPAKGIGAFIGFYFSVVFSCMIGFALYKNAHKLRLPS